VYYTVVRTRQCIFYPWDNIVLDGIATQHQKEKGSVLQAPDPSRTSLTMSDSKKGILHIVNPLADAGSEVTITGIQVSSDLVALSALSLGGNSGLLLGGTGYLTMNVSSGTNADVALEFDNSTNLSTFPVDVRYTYFTADNKEPQTSDPVRYTARIPGVKGDDMAQESSVKPQNVRTYALYFTNSNAYNQTVHSLRLSTTSGVQILAIGPAGDKGTSATVILRKAENGVYTINAFNYANSGVESSATVKPIFLSVAGTAGSVDFEFSSLDEQGDIISSGKFTLNAPLSKVENVDDLPGLVMNSYPNPANGSTTFSFSLDKAATNASMTVYDFQGHEVMNLFNARSLEQGNHVITADLSNLSSGVYYATLRTSVGRVTQAITVIR
jgi:hypothetical protein